MVCVLDPPLMLDTKDAVGFGFHFFLRSLFFYLDLEALLSVYPLFAEKGLSWSF